MSPCGTPVLRLVALRARRDSRTSVCIAIGRRVGEAFDRQGAKAPRVDFGVWVEIADWDRGIGQKCGTEDEAIVDLKEALRAYIEAFGIDDALSRANTPLTIRPLDWTLQDLTSPHG